MVIAITGTTKTFVNFDVVSMNTSLQPFSWDSTFQQPFITSINMSIALDMMLWDLTLVLL